MNATKTQKSAKSSAPKSPKSKVAPAKKATPVAHGVGRRKSCVARVWVRRAGSGKMTVNGREYNSYFDTDVARLEASRAMNIIPTAKNYDIEVNVNGGGLHGQSGATSVALARAFLTLDESYKPLLREHGLLTVDARKKERKKYGQKAARRKFQFVKR